MLRLIMVVLGGLSLAACSSVAAFDRKLPLAEGPKAEITGKRAVGKLACVAANLTPAQRQTPFGVIDAPDKTGKVNIAGNDATGRFNTEGAADMIVSSLGRTGVRIVELDFEYRKVLDWMLAKAAGQLIGTGVRQQNVTMEKGPNGKMKQVVEDIPNIPLQKGTVFPVKYAIKGAITSSDFLPGGGASVGAGGASVGYNQNRAHVRIDLRAVKMPIGNEVGSEIVATTTVEKQVVQDGVQLSLSRYFGPVTSPTLINFDAGAQRREAWQLSTGAMLDLAVADLLEQIFKVAPCSHSMVAAL